MRKQKRRNEKMRLYEWCKGRGGEERVMEETGRYKGGSRRGTQEGVRQ